MSYDIKLYTQCDHKVQDIKLSIQGLTPTYYCDLPFTSNSVKSSTYIRQYNIEETSATKAAAAITDYVYTSGDRITFGSGKIENTAGLIPFPEYYADYTTTVESCPRCLGSGIVKDLDVDVLGKLTTITGKERVRISVLKALLTGLESNTQDTSYGSQLESLIGGELDDYRGVVLQKFIQDCVKHLIAMQEYQTLDSAETIIRIATISIVRTPNVMSSFDVKITVVNALSEYIDVYLVVTQG